MTEINETMIRASEEARRRREERKARRMKQENQKTWRVAMICLAVIAVCFTISEFWIMEYNWVSAILCFALAFCVMRYLPED